MEGWVLKTVYILILPIWGVFFARAAWRHDHMFFNCAFSSPIWEALSLKSDIIHREMPWVERIVQMVGLCRGKSLLRNTEQDGGGDCGFKQWFVGWWVNRLPNQVTLTFGSAGSYSLCERQQAGGLGPLWLPLYSLPRFFLELEADPLQARALRLFTSAFVFFFARQSN